MALSLGWDNFNEHTSPASGNSTLGTWTRPRTPRGLVNDGALVMMRWWLLFVMGHYWAADAVLAGHR